MSLVCSDCRFVLRPCVVCALLRCGCRAHTTDVRYLHWRQEGQSLLPVAGSRRYGLTEVSFPIYGSSPRVHPAQQSYKGAQSND